MKVAYLEICLYSPLISQMLFSERHGGIAAIDAISRKSLFGDHPQIGTRTAPYLKYRRLPSLIDGQREITRGEKLDQRFVRIAALITHPQIFVTPIGDIDNLVKHRCLF